jgi:hypothetical protein
MNNNIQDDYCSFEVSKLLKEKGFDIFCDYGYQDDKSLLRRNGNLAQNGWYNRPTHALAIKWIRENFGVYIHLESCPDSKWFYVIEDISEKGYIRNDGSKRQMPRMLSLSEKEFNSPEEAIEAALLYTLQNLIP